MQGSFKVEGALSGVLSQQRVHRGPVSGPLPHAQLLSGRLQLQETTNPPNAPKGRHFELQAAISNSQTTNPSSNITTIFSFLPFPFFSLCPS